MNNSIKVSLTINLEGSTLHKSAESIKIGYSITQKDLHPERKFVGTEGFKIIEKGEREHFPQENEVVYQHLNINQTSYEFFTSKAGCPNKNRPTMNWWFGLSKVERLSYHLNRIAQSLNGIGYSYIIFED
jgi:hypothetical protein